MDKHANALYTNDNLFILNGLNSQSVDLIYLDPPFNSKRTYSAPIGSKSAGASFKDIWTWQDVNQGYLETVVENYPFLVRYIQSIKELHSKAMMSYITYMTQRLIQMHRVLKDTGSIYLHCDPTASHYLKIVMDRIFGKENFRNEVVWCYRQGGRSSKIYGKKHDVILWYSKTSKWIFNADPIRVPYKGTGGYQTSGRGVNIKGKIYKPNNKGKIPEDWWDIPALPPMSSERTGYPTQKPLALLHRIIKASSAEGDVVLDPFCGCATTCVAAQQLNRKWIGIDIEKQAANVLVDRLSDDAGLFKDFIQRNDIPQRTDVTIEPPTQTIKEHLFKEQKGKCNACDNEMRISDFDVDHIIPKSKGGGDYYENYQLLCHHCNITKGNRPMEYLRTKIKHREELIQSKLMFGD